MVVHIRKALARVRETCNNDWELKEIEIYRKDEADEILKLVENSGRNWVQGYDAFSPNDKNLRVGVVLYSDWVIDACGLTTDKEKVINKINDSELVGETNIQSGLWVAQRMLNPSTADKKYVILLSDGAPTTSLRMCGFPS